MSKGEKLAAAFRKFDELNDEDPRRVVVDGEDIGLELWYGRRLTEWVMRLEPDASSALRLASRCQHLKRWESPRSDFPEGRAGYLKWRAELKQFHADESAKVLREVGYEEDVVERVVSLNLKKNLKSDPECQVIEDALCLVFLQHQFDELIANTEEEKMRKIVVKTWGKMSERGHEEALKLQFSEAGAAVIKGALGG